MPANTQANEQDRAQVEHPPREVREVTGEAIEPTYVNRGHTGERPAQNAEQYGIQLEMIELIETKWGVVLLSRRRAVERIFGRLARFRRLARNDER